MKGGLNAYKRAEQKEDEIIEMPVEEPVVPFAFISPTCILDRIIKLTSAKIGYGKNVVLDLLTLNIPGGAKIGLLGRNGEGKTTLVRSFTGQIPLLNGIRECDARLSIGYFSQNLMEELSPELTVAKQFMEKTGISTEQEVRSHLAQYGFNHQKVDTLVKDLSGGEVSRLLLLIIKVRSPSLIILDEPTNHLDMESKNALIKAINDYKGSMIVISHDADFLEKTMSTFWLVDRGAVTVYKGGLSHYQKELQRFISGKATPSALQTQTVFHKQEKNTAASAPPAAAWQNGARK